MPRTHKSLPRLYLDAPLAAGSRIALDRDQTNYLLTVLRMKAGEAVVVFNGRDGAWLTRIADDHRKGAVARSRWCRPRTRRRRPTSGSASRR